MNSKFAGILVVVATPRTDAGMYDETFHVPGLNVSSETSTYSLSSLRQGLDEGAE